MNIKLLKKIILSHLRPYWKIAFIRSLKPNSKILDVGCGNDAPLLTKMLLPGCSYTGIDVGDYNQSSSKLADNYLLTEPDNFSNLICSFKNEFNGVISSHNLEHCNDRMGVLIGMLGALKQGGSIYLAFPCEQSIHFPSRQGTLNFYDDPTHKFKPPIFDEVIHTLEINGFQVTYSSKNYRPKILWFLGLVGEPISKMTKKIYLGTSEYWGFESIIWAVKLS